MNRKEIVGLGALGLVASIAIADCKSEKDLRLLPWNTPESGTSHYIIEASQVIDQDLKCIPTEVAGKTRYLADFLNHGTQFRRELKILKENEDPEYEKLRKFYDICKKSIGKEYLDGNSEPFEPKIGDLFMIDDPSQKYPGIILRQESTIDINYQTDHTVVFDGAVVLITGEGIDVLGFDLQESMEIEKRIFPVEIILPSAKMRSDYESKIGENGYISMEHFGAKLQPAISD